MLDFVFNILSSALPCSLLALGIFLTYKILDFADLSAEGSFLLGAAMCGVLIYNGVNPFVATICGTLVGGLSGLLTGVLNRVLKIPKLLSGIITLTASASIAMLIMGFQSDYEYGLFNSSISFVSKIQKGSPQQTIYSIFYPWVENSAGKYSVIAPWGDVIKVSVMFIIVVVTIIVTYFFFGTEYGMAIRATGMNEKMARAQGINVDIATIVCIVISNALIALAGSLYVQEAKAVSTISATGYLVIGLASIIMGEAVFGKRSFKNYLISVSLGAVLYFVIITVAELLGLPTELKPALYALLITIALCIPLFKKLFIRIFKPNNKLKEVK